jgi:ferredoxin-NADP reductase
MTSKILKLRLETPNVSSIMFEKPAGFTYKAGQFCNIEFPPEVIPAPNNKKNFSLSSSPTEDFLSITIRHGISLFKKKLETLEIGSSITFTAPYGKFVLNEESRKTAVFLTGGIGITPFHAMIKDTTDRNLTKKIILIYSNKSPDDIPFKKELDALDQKNEHLTIYHTITQDGTTAAGFSWSGKRGRIDEAMIRELVPEINNSEFYVCGPVQMVLSLKALLTQMQIDPTQIHFELFTGYTE